MNAPTPLAAEADEADANPEPRRGGVGDGPEGMTDARLYHHLCPVCSGIGLEFYNEARDPFTGVWERDERYCGSCNGTGLLAATP